MSFLFFVLFRNTFEIDVFEPNLVKNVSSKKTKKIMIFVFFVLFCFFLPDSVSKMSSNREQKRTKKIMPPGKSQDVLCLLCCWTPPPRVKIAPHCIYMKFSSSTYPSPPPGVSNSGEGGICQAGTYCIGGSAGETSCDFGTYNPNKQQSQCQVREIRGTLNSSHLFIY